MLVKAFLQAKLGKAGEIQQLSIDSRQKKICFVIILFGESDSLSTIVDSYSIQHENKVSFIEIGKISSSKMWIEIFCSTHVSGKRFEIPSVVGLLL